MFQRRRLLKSSAKERDYAVIFVAGHGFVDNERYYFAPSNTDLDKLGDTAVPWSDVALPKDRAPTLVERLSGGIRFDYNTRALIPEVLVNGDQWSLVRPRLDVDALVALDRMPNWL